MLSFRISSINFDKMNKMKNQSIVIKVHFNSWNSWLNEQLENGHASNVVERSHQIVYVTTRDGFFCPSHSNVCVKRNKHFDALFHKEDVNLFKRTHY